MSEFYIYFTLGLQHILDTKGLDHILFVIALSTTYNIINWRSILVLVTAFTIGHSLTLALSTLHILEIDSDLVEFMIPVTIFIAATGNILGKVPEAYNSKYDLKFLMAICFGLIHGLGFSNYLKSLLGRDTSIVKQLLAFNMGLEAGQIVIVAIFLLLSFLILNILKVNKRDWILIISSAIATKSFELIFDKISW